MATSKSNAVSVVTGAVRAFRKELCHLARRGAYKSRLVGDRKAGYYVAVQRGKKAIVVSARFAFKQLAEAWGVQKFLTSPPSRPIPLS